MIDRAAAQSAAMADLERFADDIWVAARPMRFFGVETGTRMTVVRLAGERLLIYSPVGLDESTREAVDGLGSVCAVVAPSVFHHVFVSQWMTHYPQARFAACPGLEWKRTDLAFSCVLGDTPDPLWADELEQCYFSARRENEIVLFHRRSRTLICCDSLLNLAHHASPWTRRVAWLMGNDAPGITRLERFMIRDRALARRQVDRMLSWDIDKIVLAHGDLIARDGHEVLRQAYAWL
ncbi:MAG: DUF4336 domain-containing protein [Myxococcales bacterium]|nr:DUF4336 domain-containing protein [Myxococcales bacterium]